MSETGLLAVTQARQPSNAATLHQAARTLAAKGRHEEAAQVLLEAIRLSPGLPSVHRDLGKSFRRSGNLAGAFDAIVTAIELAPESADLHAELGRILLSQGRYEEAVTAFRHSVALDGTSAQTHRDFGRALLALGDYAAATEALERAVSIAEDDVPALYHLARALAHLDRHGEAASMLQRLLEIDPDHAAAARNLHRAMDAVERGSGVEPTGHRGAKAPGTGISLCILRPLTGRDRMWLDVLGGIFTETIAASTVADWRSAIAACAADWVLPVAGDLPDGALIEAMQRRVGSGVGAVCQNADDPAAGFCMFRAAPLKACLIGLDTIGSWAEFSIAALARLQRRALVPDDQIEMRAFFWSPSSPGGEVWLIARYGPDGFGDHARALQALEPLYRSLGYRPVLVGVAAIGNAGAEYDPGSMLLLTDADAVCQAAIRHRPVVAHVLPGAGCAAADGLLGLATRLIYATDPSPGDASFGPELAQLCVAADQVFCTRPVCRDPIESEFGVLPPLIGGRGMELARLLRLARFRIGVAVGSGIGNMIQCSPTIRRVADYFDQPVDLILNADYPGCNVLFADAPWVGSILRYGPVSASTRFDVMLVLDSFGTTVPDFNADLLLITSKISAFPEPTTFHEADNNLMGARARLGIPYGAADVGRYFIGNMACAQPVARRVGLHAGCKPGIWNAKRWPFFPQLASRLATAGFEVLSVGSLGEYVPDTVDATGSCLADTIAAIGTCSYFISNDSGLMHVADALGVPLTAIFAPTSIIKNGPLAPTSQVVSLKKDCAPCQFRRLDLATCRCIGEISLETVWDRVTEHMARPLGHDTRCALPALCIPLVVFTALDPRDMPAVPLGTIVIGCDWSETAGFPALDQLNGFLQANTAQKGAGAGFVFLSPHFAYSRDYLLECAHAFAEHGGRDVVIGGLRYDRATACFFHNACMTQGKTTLGLIALGCFSLATLLAATAAAVPGPLRLLRAEDSFHIIDGQSLFQPHGLRVQQSIEAAAISRAEHQLGFHAAAQADSMLSLSSRLGFHLKPGELLDQVLAELDRDGYTGRSVELLLQTGETMRAAERVIRLLSRPPDLVKLGNAAFGDLLQTVRTIGLDAEFVAAFQTDAGTIASRFFNHLIAAFESAALVLELFAFDSLVLDCAAAILHSPVVRPIGRLVEGAARFCSTGLLVDLLHRIAGSRHAAQLRDPLLIRAAGDGLIGRSYSPFTLPVYGLTEQDILAGASPEKHVLQQIRLGDRTGFIRDVNRVLAAPKGAAILCSLLRVYTSELRRFSLQPGEICYPVHLELREKLGLVVIMNDSGAATTHLEAGVRAPTDPLVAAWYSRRGEYGPLNTILARWLTADGAMPIHLKGRDRTELFSSCSIGYALPTAKDRGKVSVILAARNPHQILMRMAVDSVLGQTYGNLELIIVDDGSDPACAQQLRRVAATDPRIHLLRSRESRGPYHCRNRALEVATGDFIAFHDADDVAHPQRLELQIGALAASDIYQLCFASHMRFDAAGALQFEVNPDILSLRGDGPVTAVCRRRGLDAVGWFAEVRSRGDIEMRSRFRTAYGGHAIRFLDAPLMYCSGSSATLSATATICFGEYVALFRRAFRHRAWPPVLDGAFVSPCVGRLAIPPILGSQARW